MTNPAHSLGARAETAVAAWVSANGWAVLARRHRTAVGELDLVAVDPDGVLVALEVKCRRTDRIGHAAEGLRPAQVRRIRRCLLDYRGGLGLEGGMDLRVDLVTVERCPSSTQWRLRRIPQIDAW